MCIEAFFLDPLVHVDRVGGSFLLMAPQAQRSSSPSADFDDFWIRQLRTDLCPSSNESKIDITTLVLRYQFAFNFCGREQFNIRLKSVWVNKIFSSPIAYCEKKSSRPAFLKGVVFRLSYTPAATITTSPCENFDVKFWRLELRRALLLRPPESLKPPLKTESGAIGVTAYALYDFYQSHPFCPTKLVFIREVTKLLRDIYPNAALFQGNAVIGLHFRLCIGKYWRPRKILVNQ
jgi:hypothetical protein